MMTETRKLETEIKLARQWRVPVLITAPPDRARAVVQAIAGTRQSSMAADDLAVDGERPPREGLANRTTRSSDADLVVWEVHALNDVEQESLLQLLIDDERAASRRVIATSSVCLLDRVKRGTFSARLFYRLNAIHIVSDAVCPARRSMP